METSIKFDIEIIFKKAYNKIVMGKKIKSVFIVDDNELLSEALLDYITDKTMYDVKIFHTGEECIKHLREQPDVVILDYNLDSVDKQAANGSMILEKIKRLDNSIHVIMLSSQDAYGTALQTITKGAEDYVIKDDNAFKKIVSIIQSL